MNISIISGRLGKDPELKTGQSGAEFCNFSVAVDRRPDKDGKKETDWFRCTAFGKSAAFVEKYFKKGDGIELQGRMENHPYEDKDTKKNRDSWQFMVDRIEFPKGKNSEAKTDAAAAPDGFQQINEDDIPF